MATSTGAVVDADTMGSSGGPACADPGVSSFDIGARQHYRSLGVDGRKIGTSNMLRELKHSRASAGCEQEGDASIVSSARMCWPQILNIALFALLSLYFVKVTNAEEVNMGGTKHFATTPPTSDVRGTQRKGVPFAKPAEHLLRCLVQERVREVSFRSIFFEIMRDH